MEWSPQQKEALTKVRQWLDTDPSRPFILSGYAGTGKTTLARHIASEIGGYVPFITFTGKAAHVLRKKGCAEATTIHQLIYRPKIQCHQRLRDLEEQVAELEARGDHHLVPRVEAMIAAEKQRLKQPRFHLLEESRASEAEAIILDEYSMVNNHVGKDLESFGRPIIALGDPGQLPPVGGKGYFKGEPDVVLTEVHRQALDSPIIQLAQMARRGEDIPYGEYGLSRVVPWGVIGPEEAMAYDQILVGRNATRRIANARAREVLGFKEHWPQTGERLVCTKNNHKIGLMNGSTWTVEHSYLNEVGQVSLEIYDADERHQVEAYLAPFEGRELARFERDAEWFDYGYAMTVHKSQGSEWGSVLIFDESDTFGPIRHQHLYTAITRAAERVTIVK